MTHINDYVADQHEEKKKLKRKLENTVQVKKTLSLGLATSNHEYSMAYEK